MSVSGGLYTGQEMAQHIWEQLQEKLSTFGEN
jgi:hypothetical protein